jgi:peptide-methionine (R)-S-oxide reductase
MSTDDYKSKLSPEAFKVCRLAATEHPFSGIYNEHWLLGVYTCACCDEPLFESEKKFNAGCGWPSFYQSIDKQVSYIEDNSLGMQRTEIQCANCQSHLGHVFNDGPEPTGQRYCVNSLSLQFIEKA